ncbi:MAG: type III-B CRISPR module-associated protein Cmr5 [Kiritimatiellia bacterium]|jgi:CRISPR type III-B/RAMP module-associated protein Cmr5
MQNLEQIRAKNALKFLENDPFNKNKKAGKNDGDGEEQGSGDVLSGFPSLIINNGLLATVAFSIAKKGNYQKIYDAISIHLKDKDIGLLPANVELVEHLTKSDSTQLRLCTAEALAYLAYLKRFGKKE